MGEAADVSAGLRLTNEKSDEELAAFLGTDAFAMLGRPWLRTDRRSDMNATDDMRIEKPEGDVPRSDEPCPLCDAAASQPHAENCPWRLWAEARA